MLYFSSFLQDLFGPLLSDSWLILSILFTDWPKSAESTDISQAVFGAKCFPAILFFAFSVPPFNFTVGWLPQLSEKLKTIPQPDIKFDGYERCPHYRIHYVWPELHFPISPGSFESMPWPHHQHGRHAPIDFISEFESPTEVEQAWGSRR